MTDRAEPVEFSFEPSTLAMFDAFYLAYPELRPRMAALLGVSVAGTAAGTLLAVAGADPVFWLGSFLVTVLALGVLGWWALSRCRGSVFAAGPGTARTDDQGLLVRPTDAKPTLLPWSALRGWVASDRLVVLLPGGRTRRPLHVIPTDVFDDEADAETFRDLLRWHLGQPARS